MGELGVSGPTSSTKAPRPEEVEPFIRGSAFSRGAGCSYPRANPRDKDRLPLDTWGTAMIPVGVRIEFTGDAEEVQIAYMTSTEELGYRGDGAGRNFSLWRGGVLVDEQPAKLGEAKVRLSTGIGSLGTHASGPDGGNASSDVPAIVYLPEGMRPSILSLEGIGGTITPAEVQPRWIAYGDSVAEGWVASSPAGAWPAIAGRQYGLDVVNMGYAGAARGEIVSAQHIAGLEPQSFAVISISHGTNCWTRIPFSAGMIAEGTKAFIEVIRGSHPEVPIVVASPVIRPDAEETPNCLGATLGDLRDAIEASVIKLINAGDCKLVLLSGLRMIGQEHLADGIHPNDEGHQVMARIIGNAVAIAAGTARQSGTPGTDGGSGTPGTPGGSG